MVDEPIFVTAFPDKVILQESYGYRCSLSGNPQYASKGNATGSVSFSLPYDDKTLQKPIVEKELAVVVERLRRSPTNQVLTARTGFLGVINSGNSGFAERYGNIEQTSTVLPIEIPIRSPELQTNEGLFKGEHLLKVEFEYEPEYPERVPFEVLAQVYDESLLEEELTSVFSSMVKHRDQIKAIIKQVNMHKGFSNSLFITLRLKVSFTEAQLQALGGEFEKGVGKVELADLELIWPMNIAAESVKAFVGKDAKHIEYSAFQGSLLLRNVDLERQQQKQGRNVIDFISPLIALRINRPCDLYQLDSLIGKLHLVLDGSLSGLRLSNFNNRGWQVQVQQKVTTQLMVDFELHLAELFQRKFYFPMQRIALPGVQLNVERMEDVKKLLEDNEFSASELDIATTSDAMEVLLLASRKFGNSELHLLLLLSGKIKLSMITTEFDGNKKVEHQDRIGHTTITMRARYTGSSKDNLQLFNKIHRDIKERLQFVSTI